MLHHNSKKACDEDPEDDLDLVQVALRQSKDTFMKQKKADQGFQIQKEEEDSSPKNSLKHTLTRMTIGSDATFHNC